MKSGSYLPWRLAWNVFSTDLLARFFVSKVIAIAHAASVFKLLTCLGPRLKVKPIKSSTASSNCFLHEAWIKILILSFLIDQVSLRDNDSFVVIIITAYLLCPDNFKTLGVVLLFARPRSVHVDTRAGSPGLLRTVRARP